MICPRYNIHLDLELNTNGKIAWGDINKIKESFREKNSLDKDAEIFIVNIYKLEDK